MNYGADYKKLPVYSKDSGKGREVTQDVYVVTDQIVNFTMIGKPGDDTFVLIDTGMPKRSEKIIEAAKERFGPGVKPSVIVLTHGHFDHVGNIIELIEEWDVPVYASKVEFPHLTGKEAYPAPDYKAEGGAVTKLSKFFPVEPIDLGERIQPLPENGTVPGLSDFKWIPVPGHTKGQVAFFREADRLLIAADAFVTTKEEELYAVLTQKEVVSGPPRYLTPDWKSAKESAVKLFELNPDYAITGHGHPMSGQELSEGLKDLIDHWEEQVLPSHGKFVKDTSEH